ncbi:hypothetical protein [Streptomyces sp. NPDC091219]|uniref:DUF6461 domain-containing protein n=1 Tax=Streptomyces sp. NPDC091219 TaxID=3155193 RepID=UPI00344DE634
MIIGMGVRCPLSEAEGRMTVMAEGMSWLAGRQSIAFGGYHVVLARGLSPKGLAERLAAALRYDAEHVVVSVGERTGTSLLELMDDYGDVGLRLGSVGDWVYAVAYGGWQAEFGPLAPVSRDGVHVCLLEYEEENGKPVPPQFAYFQDGELLAAFNLHLDGSWGTKRSKATPIQPRDCRSGSRLPAFRIRSVTEGRFTASRWASWRSSSDLRCRGNRS